MSWLMVFGIVCLGIFLFLAGGAKDDPDEEREGDDE